ncbi:MAG: shikimate dehydrogenase [Chitinophagaceae bacterium]|nr:shikimate dehydrogenase [Chitinophagaceae bacterium]
MKHFGLIGYPLTHSFSKKYFGDKFQRENIADCVYENFPLVSVEEFPVLIQSQKDIIGLNVTIPYKESVMSFLEEIDETAREIGAVNTIRISDGKLKGFNTDAYGFMQSIMKLLEPHHNNALILGTGGSSKAVAWSLKKMGIDFQFVSRHPSGIDEISYEVANADIRHCKIIINTTPVGMYPLVTAAPDISYENITPSHLLFDLIYNPEETLFLKKGKARQAKTKNGLEMLQLQAERSWQIWNT